MKYDLCFLENNKIFLRGTIPQVAEQKNFSHNRNFLARFSPHIYHAFPCDNLFYCESYIYICMYIYAHLYIIYMRLPKWLSAKESACNAGDPGSISGSGRSPGEGKGNPLQYSCLGNPMDKGT